MSATGGETGFIDAAEAYTRLPVALRERIGDIFAVHVERFPRGPEPNRVRQPVVLLHPVTGIPILFVNPLFTESIPDADDDSLLVELQTSFAAPTIQYWHRWRPGDLLIWDNLVLQHARNEFPATDRRTIRRCQIDFSRGDQCDPQRSRTHHRNQGSASAICCGVYCLAWSRRTRRRILPEGDFGIASRNVTLRTRL